LSLIGLIVLLIVLVNLTPVQNFLAQRATGILSDKLKTKVSIRNIRIDFLNHLLIEGLYIEDQANDTLLYAGRAEVRITDWFVVTGEKPVIKYLGLHNAYGNLYRKNNSDIWNYQFVIDAFDTGKPNKDTTKTKDEFELDLKELDIRNVRFNMNDAWAGSDMNIGIGDLKMDADELDLKKRRIDVDELAIKEFAMQMRDYEGGKPAKARQQQPIDTTAFNPDKWLINLDKLSLENCAFRLESGKNAPLKNEFDPGHMAITGINLDVEDLTITGDTLRSNLKHLSANERCGLVVKEFRAKVTVSPVASICEDLYLETNNSILQDYYAMHYDRFPDFTHYITKVRMEANLEKTSLDSRDIAYFAPALREIPTLLSASGHISGTVSDIQGKDLHLSDGNSTVKGDLHMKGLPDINSTFIDYSNGELLTTGQGILKYAPSLRNDPNIAVEKLSYVYFKGNYKGYIENFAANGTLSTNLGTITSDINLTIPDFNTNTAAYSGTVSTENFNLGALLRQPDLGTLTFKGTVKGNSFDPAMAQVEINATIGHVTYNNYQYKNIYAEGVLAKKRFDGKLLVDDPNLAMAFNGSFDFNDNLPKINATANVLSSDLKALKLTTDSIQLVADFDLNATASNIDDFIGIARLYNINLMRNGHELDVDSIYVNSSMEGEEKLLAIESNDVSAQLRGDFELSTLPYSFQYYVSGYLPNYIKAPDQAAPHQDISFTIATKTIDSILAVISPGISGFDHTILNGSLNTITQKLNLNLKSAHGAIGAVNMYDIELKGEGDFRKLIVDGSVNRVIVGDSALNGALSLKTTLGNDSLSFSIATTSEDLYGTATLNGQAFASGDSLYLTMLPSDFYLNKHKWEIPNGSNIVFSDNYLFVKDLFLQAGLQKISVNSQDELSTQSLNIKVENLDVHELGAVAGLDEYEAEGRINGEVRIDHIFRSQYFAAKIRGTDVKIGDDTLGNVILSGNYDLKKDLLFLDPESGIYNGGSSINVFGNMRTDSTSNQQLDGGVRFLNAPLSWAEATMTGFLSNIEGTASGEVHIGGTGVSPDIKGTVYLNKVSTKVDFLGLTYRIPEAKIIVDEKKIDIGEVAVYDPKGNVANLNGIITHERFEKMRLSFSMKADEFEVIKLKDYESSVFYGNLTAKIDRFNVTGRPNNIKIDITATPVKKSHLFLPVDQGDSEVSTYDYITFKQYGQEQLPAVKKSDNKVTLVINANLTPDGEITMVIDPSAGDAINASGYGNLKINIPIGGDVTMYGDYLLESGSYTFTFKQLFFKRTFILDQGSKISFKGPISATTLNVEGIYTTKARLYDLLTEGEKTIIATDETESADAKTPQNVDVKLHMRGSLEEPSLGFNIDLQERRSMATLAYLKLEAINKNERELLDQVASLLLVNTFIPQTGMASGSSSAVGVAVNNISDIVSSSASTQLTNIVNKLLGNDDLSIDLKYKNYNLSDPTNGGLVRNEVTGTVTQNLLKDRLVVEVGGSYDWGRPTSGNANSNAFNLAGDFRLHWLLTESGNLRMNLFRSNSYDVLSDQNISRGGIGLSWRKSFDGLGEFFNNGNKKVPKTIGPEPYIPDTNRNKGTQ
jgi:hypothetical protein